MRGMTPFVPARALLHVLLLALSGATLEAQVARPDPARTWPVDRVLARFEADVRSRAVNSPGSEIVYGILRLPASYAARKDSLLDGLERLALTSADQNVRHVATSRVAFAGQTGRASPPVPGVLSRLVRIYRSQPDATVRLSIRNRLPLQAERRAAAAFLRAIASEPDNRVELGPEGYFSPGDPRVEALNRLAEMGEVGREVLQAMHRSGEARSPQARMILEEMARRGFPVHDAAPARP